MHYFVGFLVLSLALAANARDFLDMKKLEPLSKSCVEEQKMELQAFNDAVMNNTDEKNVQARCALKCALMKLADKDGKPIPAEIEKIIPDQVLETSKDAVVEGLSKCLVETKSDTKDDQECTVAKNVYVCAKEMMAKIDSVTEAPKQ